jgi:hypothetical protein
MLGERKLTLQEKAEAILHTTLECGCVATDHGLEGYVVEGGHTCDKQVLRQQAQERKEERFRMRSESAQRRDAPLYHKPFNLLR